MNMKYHIHIVPVYTHNTSYSKKTKTALRPFILISFHVLNMYILLHAPYM